MGGERSCERAAGSGVRRRSRRRSPGGRIISKGAIHQTTLTLSDALADRGITVNALNPGPVDTGWAEPDLAERVGRALPAGRWATPAEVARVVRWLASGESRWITGQVIDAEGGFRRWVL